MASLGSAILDFNSVIRGHGCLDTCHWRIINCSARQRQWTWRWCGWSPKWRCSCTTHAQRFLAHCLALHSARRSDFLWSNRTQKVWECLRSSLQVVILLHFCFNCDTLELAIESVISLVGCLTNVPTDQQEHSRLTNVRRFIEQRLTASVYSIMPTISQ